MRSNICTTESSTATWEIHWERWHTFTSDQHVSAEHMNVLSLHVCVCVRWRFSATSTTCCPYLATVLRSNRQSGTKHDITFRWKQKDKPLLIKNLLHGFLIFFLNFKSFCECGLHLCIDILHHISTGAGDLWPRQVSWYGSVSLHWWGAANHLRVQGK